MNKELVERFRNYEFHLLDDEFEGQFDFTIKELINETTLLCDLEPRTPEERCALIEALILDLTELKNEQE